MKKGDEIAERIERVYAAIADDPEITVNGLSDLLNITQKQTENVIKGLKKQSVYTAKVMHVTENG